MHASIGGRARRRWPAPATLLPALAVLVLVSPFLSWRETSQVVVGRLVVPAQGAGAAAAAAQPAVAALVSDALAAADQQASDCWLDVEETPLASQCTLLRDACVDQGGVILYDPVYEPEVNGKPRDLPVLEPTPRHSKHPFTFRSRGHVDTQAALPGIPVRTAGRSEPRFYLQEPVFSNCTVPVVYWQHQGFNFAHVFRDNAARFYAVLKETQWAQHARLVLMTGGGQALSGMARQLWQPLSHLRVDAWAEFSDRLRDGEVGAPPADGGALPPPSFEGTEQRCFSAMYFCTGDIAAKHVYQMHAFGRHVVGVYRQQQAQQLQAARRDMLDAAAAASKSKALRQRLRGLPPQPPVSVLRQLGESGSGRQEAVQLRIVFLKRDGTRDGSERQLLNAAELVRRCNGWRYKAPTGAAVSAVCWEAETPTLLASIAAAQEADVLIGAHGANLANAWMTRPGSSAIELTMHGFDEQCQPGGDCPHRNIPRRNSQDPDTQVAMWKLLLCDPKEGRSWTPGLRETLERAKGVAQGDDWPKHRNLIVRWEALEAALRAAVDTAGDMQRYRQRWQEGTWWWLTTASQVVPAGPSLDQTCSKARAAGLIN